MTITLERPKECWKNALSDGLSIQACSTNLIYITVSPLSADCDMLAHGTKSSSVNYKHR